MPTIKRFEDLEVWRLAMEVAEQVYALCRKDPLRRDASLCDQMQRAAVSVPSNIAEGIENSSRNQFLRFLFIARGSAGELRTQLLLTGRVHRLDVTTVTTKCERLSKQLWGFIQYLKTTDYAAGDARDGKPKSGASGKRGSRGGVASQSETDVRQPTSSKHKYRLL
jgi:four helix bundle protein